MLLLVALACASAATPVPAAPCSRLTYVYDAAAGDFAGNLGKTVDIQFHAASDTWSAQFAAAPAVSFHGTYTVTGNIISIVHKGGSTDGTANKLTLQDGGTFTEASESAPGTDYASGHYSCGAPAPAPAAACDDAWTIVAGVFIALWALAALALLRVHAGAPGRLIP